MVAKALPKRSVLFSVVTPVYNTPLDVLTEMIASVRKQRFADWELILVDDRSPNAKVREILRAAAEQEPRIRVIERAVNGGIVAASNDGIEAAQGEFIALLDHDDLLTPNALHVVNKEIEKTPEVDYLYSDEDKVYPGGKIADPFRKPDWSPERLRQQMYTAHLSVIRTELVREVGGFRPGFDGSQDHDLILRVTEQARKIVHIPRVLYHWRIIPGSAAGDIDAKPYAWDAGLKAVNEHLVRVGIKATAEKGKEPGYYTITRQPDLTSSVSVIIPTRGSRAIIWGRWRTLVVEAVRSVVAHSENPNIEFVIVYDTSTPESVLDELREVVSEPQLKLVEYTEKFNFSRKCNLGAIMSSGDILVFLNDDTEATSDGVIDQLIAPLAEKDVGLTGARLLFEDTRHQHAGVTYGGGRMTHWYFKKPRDAQGRFGSLWMNREVSALTAACVAVRRETFVEVGGFSEYLDASFNDVDFSLKLRFSGYRLVWLQNVVLYHFESLTRDPSVKAEEISFITRRWGGLSQREQYRA